MEIEYTINSDNHYQGGAFLIKEIINYIYKNNDFSVEGIAKALDISEDIASEYKKKLESGGYIKRESCSTEKCKGCSCGCSDKTLNPIIKWEVTSKGLKLIK